VSATPTASDLPAATATTTESFARPNLLVNYQQGTTPASSTGSPVQLDSYLQGILRSYVTVWDKAFQQAGLQAAPSLTYDITSRTDHYVSTCTSRGKRIVVTRTYGKLFYCPDDGLKNGAGGIALPADVLGKLWTQAPRKVADLAGAISATRQAGLILTTWLSSQGITPMFPNPTTQLYAGICLSGAWAHGVYTQDNYTDKELSTALRLSLSIPSEADGQALPSSPEDMQQKIAWALAFRTGDEGTCLVGIRK
jgi:hypothetical protein